jgi:histidyl-tRNA synthetase
MIQRPRGTRDFGPEEMEKRRRLEVMMRRTALRFGFREVATPIFEHTELFTLKSGPAIVEDIYAFQDKGGREIALRPELTAPVIRFFVNELTNFPRPLKLFYVGPCFRYERPQSGRYREFYQFGAELIGNKNPESDAEVIGLAASIMRAIGLGEYHIRVGHIGILRDRMSDYGVDDGSCAKILQKLDKKMYEEARPLMEEAGIPDHAIEEMLGITQVRGDVSVLEGMKGEDIDYLKGVFQVLEWYGMDDIEVDLGVVRGLDYYTGIVFEVEAPSLGAEKQVCGGGSYSLSELFGGEPTFSTGFAIGFDRVLMALDKEGVDNELEGLDVFVVPVDDDLRSLAFQLTARLRESGLATDVDLMRRSIGKSFKYADSMGAKFAVVVGQRELDQGSISVRDMRSGEQRLVSLDEVVGHLLEETRKVRSS